MGSIRWLGRSPGSTWQAIPAFFLGKPHGQGLEGYSPWRQLSTCTHIAVHYLEFRRTCVFLEVLIQLKQTSKLYIEHNNSLIRRFFLNFNWRLITLQFCGGFCHSFM